MRRRVSQLNGYTQPVSDGSLYPVINRLTRAGLIEWRADPAVEAARYVLSPSAAGRADMFQRLRKPAGRKGGGGCAGGGVAGWRGGGVAG
ncbi:helix-turn-helix transcriptional regulator [Streptomyces sp. AD2-2]|nr:helix-turn-helix transcriptional regulator [Streptomyces sp. AD2-2]